MSWSGHQTRAQLRAGVEEWLQQHQDPRDPLAKPVELLLELFLAATSWRTMVGRWLSAIIISAVIIGIGEAALHQPESNVATPRSGEAHAMQEWIDAGEASRLMRCEGEGLAFVNGRCRTTASGGWLIPLEAQQLLAERPSTGSTDENTTASRGVVSNPFEEGR